MKEACKRVTSRWLSPSIRLSRCFCPGRGHLFNSTKSVWILQKIRDLVPKLSNIKTRSSFEANNEIRDTRIIHRCGGLGLRSCLSGIVWPAEIHRRAAECGWMTCVNAMYSLEYSTVVKHPRLDQPATMPKRKTTSKATGSVSTAATHTPPTDVKFPELSTKKGLECRVLLEDQILLIDVRMKTGDVSRNTT